MTCAEIERFLRDNPRCRLPDAAAAHALGCAACRDLIRELQGLDDLLASLPEAELPPFLSARLLAGARPPRRPAAALGPLWAPIAAAAAGVALVLFSAVKPAPDLALHPRGDEPALPAAGIGVPPPGAVAATAGTRIYPVWPADRDVVTPDELAITVSLYPPVKVAGDVRVAVDDRDLTGDTEISAECLSLSPTHLAPGRHTVTVSCARADGGRQSVSWSFYLLEGAS